jgi:3-isopropylmalate/(R)-2-methylmalate dehydratase small subunit
MKKFIKHTGVCVPFYIQNIDTDQIVPKKFLLNVERTGFDKALFYDLRYHADGSPVEDFVLNKPEYKNGSILLAGANFGCGSSREHAPWALAEYGFRAILAPGFADIFYNNCFKIGLLPVIMKPDLVLELVKKSKEIENYELTIDLVNQEISDQFNFNQTFSVNEFRKNSLIRGLDDIDLTLLNGDKITEFEKNRVSFFPSNA